MIHKKRERFEKGKIKMERKKDELIANSRTNVNHLRSTTKNNYNRNSNRDLKSDSRPIQKRGRRPKNETITEEFGFKSSKLKIIPLGGLQEVGKNITVFEYENEMIIVDCGVSFPEDDMLGIDLVIPDFTYLVKNKDKRFSNHSWSRRSYWFYSLFLKRNQCSNICNKTYCRFNK